MVDPHNFHDDYMGHLVTRNFKVGGMKEPDAGTEIEENLGKIDGVRKVAADKTSRMVSIQFDPGEVSEEWLTRTLNSMGHSILAD